MRSLLSVILCALAIGCSDSKNKDVPAATNPNKLVIGGNNVRPQMGLFALRAEDAAKVDAAMSTSSKQAYELAQKLAVKTWGGDRSFCEDAVRQTIGFFGTDGMMSAEQLAAWKTTELAALEQQHLPAIRASHQQMIGEDDKSACAKDLAMYHAALRLAATDKLELRNFGF